MTEIAATSPAQHAIFRVDKFIVPPQALDEFLARLRGTHRVLDRQPGCLQNLVLTQTAGSGEFNVVTVVEWASPAAMASAKAEMQAQYRLEGFDSQAFMARLGVRADLANYARAQASVAPTPTATLPPAHAVAPG